MHQSLNIPQHLKHVATLAYEMFNIEIECRNVRVSLFLWCDVMVAGGVTRGGMIERHSGGGRRRWRGRNGGRSRNQGRDRVRQGRLLQDILACLLYDRCTGTMHASQVSRMQAQSFYFRLILKFTKHKTQINSTEIILHFRLQVAELDINKQNP